jgi:hypothetical protein
MKDYKLLFILSLKYILIIAQTDYNKVDEKEKMGLERVLSRVQKIIVMRN